MQRAILFIGLNCPDIRWICDCVITNRLKIVGYATVTQKADDFSDRHL